MFHKTLFITIILCIVGVAIGFHYFSETSGLLNRYQKLGLVQSDLKYEKVERSWGDQGLIFYQVQFPFINTPIKADKMSLSLEDSGISMKLKNARIKVIEGLKKAYNSDVSEKLNTYVPYKDFITQTDVSIFPENSDEQKDISVQYLINYTDGTVNMRFFDYSAQVFDVYAKMNENQTRIIMLCLKYYFGPIN